MVSITFLTSIRFFSRVRVGLKLESLAGRFTMLRMLKNSPGFVNAGATLALGKSQRTNLPRIASEVGVRAVHFFKAMDREHLPTTLGERQR